MPESCRGGWGLAARTRGALMLLILAMHGTGCGMGASSVVPGPTAKAASPLKARGTPRAASGHPEIARPAVPFPGGGAGGGRGSGNSTSGRIGDSALPRKLRPQRSKGNSTSSAARGGNLTSSRQGRLLLRGQLGDKCLHPEGCLKRASFGYPWPEPKLRMFCSIHRLAGQVDVKHKRCSFEHCNRHVVDFKSGTCLTHVTASPHARRASSPRMSIMYQNRLCVAEGCRQLARYGAKGGKNATTCAGHRLEGMVDVRRKSCSIASCDGVATYGDAESGTATVCAKHRLAGQIDFKHKRCQFPLEICMRQPSYGDASEGISRYCAAHKREGDVDVRSTPCRHAGCRRSASFGVAGSRKLLFCSEHSRADHINIRKSSRSRDLLAYGHWELLWKDSESVIKFCRQDGDWAGTGHTVGAVHGVRGRVMSEEREEVQPLQRGSQGGGGGDLNHGKRRKGNAGILLSGREFLRQRESKGGEEKASGGGGLHHLRGGGSVSSKPSLGTLCGCGALSNPLPVLGLSCGQLPVGGRRGLGAFAWCWGGLRMGHGEGRGCWTGAIRLRGGCSKSIGLAPSKPHDCVNKGAPRAGTTSKGRNSVWRQRGNRTALGAKGRVTCIKCHKTASFGSLSDRKRVACKAHKEEGHVDLCMLNCTCRVEGCARIASFGNLVDRVRLFCSLHKESDHLNLKNRLCDVSECLGQALYGSDYDRRPLFCSEHRRPLDVDVRSKRCKTAGCRKQPGYHRDHCATHSRDPNAPKLDSKMSPAGRRLCEKEGCTTTASYGVDRVRVCTKHRKIGDRDLVSKMCQYPGCHKQASYVIHKDKTQKNATTAPRDSDFDVPPPSPAQPNQKMRRMRGQSLTGWFCISHKPDGATQSRNRKCTSCDRTASYSWEGKSPLLCAQHRMEGMVNRRIPHCQFVDGCNSVASYGDANITAGQRVVGIFCGLHRGPSHVLVHARDRRRKAPVDSA